MARKPRRRDPVLQIGDRAITLGHYLKVYRLQVLLEPYITPIERASVLPMKLLENLVDDELARQLAVERGIKVTKKQIDVAMRGHFGPEVATDGEKFQEHYSYVRQITGLSDAEYRAMTEAALLTDALDEQLRDNVPQSGPQAHIRVILVERQYDGDQVTRDLLAGQDFAQVAAERSRDPSCTKGGDVGWVPRGTISPELDNLVWTVPVGTFGGPVAAWNGYVFVLVEDRQPDRPYSEEQRAGVQGAALKFAILNARKRLRVEWFWDSDKYTWLMDQCHDLLTAPELQP